MDNTFFRFASLWLAIALECWHVAALVTLDGSIIRSNDHHFINPTPEEKARARALIGTVAIDNTKPLGEEELLRGSPGKGSKLSSAFSFDTWPQGIINYVVDTQFNSTVRDNILAGIMDIEDNTCIRFQEVNVSSVVGDYINITTGFSDGCFVAGPPGYNKGIGPHLMHLVLEPFCAFVSFFYNDIFFKTQYMYL